MKIMLNMDAKPSETLILEDSYYGRTAVKECANLMPIDKLKDVNMKNIKSFLKEMNRKKIHLKFKKIILGMIKN